MDGQPMTAHAAVPCERQSPRCLTEQEAELLEFERTCGNAFWSTEGDRGFLVLGLCMVLSEAVFGWVAFKAVWFGWLAMPGWW